MKSILTVPCCLLLVGCGSASSYVHSDTTLGRVVIYRNGVAYFERYAKIDGEQLKLSVPADKVDDFLKSLTVVDARTGEPAPVAYPTTSPGSESGTLDMNIHLPGPSPHQLRLSYVTESPSWKPSYRVVLGKDGKVDMQAWAIVDNTSGEDWNRVRLGVGSSSAMSFRFDLRSVRNVQRETLRSDDLFALAPPIGQASYPEKAAAEKKPQVLAELNDESLGPDAVKNAAPAPDAARKVSEARGRKYRSQPTEQEAGRALVLGASAATTAPAASRPPAEPKQAQLDQTLKSLQTSRELVTIEGFANPSDGDKVAASLERANRVRDQFVASGLDPNRVVVVGRGEQPGHAGGVRIVRGGDADGKAAAQPDPTTSAPPLPTDPIGTSHFESSAAMSVPRGTSAMVSILHTGTEGEVVYLYDPEGARGNAQFPFRSMRIKNPTDSALESGPVTVFGDGKFVGEGLCEPIPARSVAFVPFALDRQIVAVRKTDERDEIARILTVQRGVFSTEVEHLRKESVVLHNRLPQRATVYLRHTVAPGYKLGKAPAHQERVGNAYLFRVELEPNATTEVTIEQGTPLFRTTDIRTPAGLEMVKVFVSSSASEGPLRGAVSELLKLHAETENYEQHIETMRQQMQEYRTRMDELHVQIVTLRAVKTGGPLMRDLEKKLGDMSDKLSKATMDLVSLEEKRMISRIHFEDGVADLSLEKQTPPEPTAKSK
jgi:outer membrane protein OmpA-like peptidoglycan-associated protein